MASTDPTSNDSDSDVFGSLPRSRPQRRSAKRDRPADTPATAGGGTAGRPTTTARGRPGAGAGTRAARAPEPAPIPPVPAAGYATPPPRDDRPLHGLELITTAVEALGELAAIAMTATAQAVRAALRSLPRP